MAPKRLTIVVLAAFTLILLHLALRLRSTHRMLHRPLPHEAPPNRFAVVTLLLGGDEAAMQLVPRGIQCLKMLARRLPAHIPRVCLYDKRIRVGMVDGWEMVPVSPILAPHGDVSNHYTSAGLYTKLHVWNLTAYEAVLYLDLDTLPLSSIYPIFEELPRMETVGMVRDTLGASKGYNAGVMLIRPSAAEFKGLVNNIDVIQHTLDGAEQNYINVYFGSRIHELPSVWNVLNNDRTKHPVAWYAIEDRIAILHFVAKPWSPIQCLQDGVVDMCLVWHWL